MERKIKRTFAVLMAIIMTIAAAPIGSMARLDIGTKASAVKFEAPYTYCINNNEAIITEIATITGDVIIPNTLDGYPVTSISGRGSYTITSIKIPETVRFIDRGTFSNCKELINIELPENLESISQDAFSGNTGLTEIKIPSRVSYIGWFAFSGCSNLKRITVDENNLYYSSDENGVLFNKDKTELLVYPEGNETKSYDIPESVVYIDGWAMNHIKNLEILTIPKSVKSISDTNLGFYEFIDCPSLKKIIVDEENKRYSSDEYGVLFDKDKTTLYNFPDNTDVRSYIIPNTVNSIGNYAFETVKLDSIFIPKLCRLGGEGIKLFAHDVYCASTQEFGENITADRFHYNVADAETHWTSETVPATCTEDGEITYTCPCGYSYTEVIPATGHADKNTDGECDNCGEIICNCNCHKSGPMSFLYKIITIFWRIFRINKTCACGKAHY